MSFFSLAGANLLSPVVLPYLLGIVAKLLKSDLKVPDSIYQFLTIYLLFSLGLKGGAEVSYLSFSDLFLPVSATLVLALVTPVSAFFAARSFVKLGQADSAALGAHYGSVSVVTFITAMTFLQNEEQRLEPFLTALVVVLEIPAIILALVVGKRAMKNLEKSEGRIASADEERFKHDGGILQAVQEILTSKSIVLLVGGLVIGAVSSSESLAKVEPFFFKPFQGVVSLFLLEMGLLTASRISDLRKVGVRLLIFAIFVPVFHAFLGILLGHAIGMGQGGATILGVLAASASYIAAPAAVRVALPEANPSIYLTASLGFTFPFNLAFGIPLYYHIAVLTQRFFV